MHQPPPPQPPVTSTLRIKFPHFSCTCSLAEKIRAARVNKERQLQLQGNAVIKAQQQEYDAAFNLYVQQVSPL